MSEHLTHPEVTTGKKPAKNSRRKHPLDGTKAVVIERPGSPSVGLQERKLQAPSDEAPKPSKTSSGNLGQGRSCLRSSPCATSPDTKSSSTATRATKHVRFKLDPIPESDQNEYNNSDNEDDFEIIGDSDSSSFLGEEPLTICKSDAHTEYQDHQVGNPVEESSQCNKGGVLKYALSTLFGRPLQHKRTRKP